jgi:Aromatic-ring-opening dioxygenase LigAB, LigA subunit
MSLYYVQKLLYRLNRDPRVRQRFQENRSEVLAEYGLTEEERTAIVTGDIGLLYVLGVNGQLLMHFSALLGQSWDEYIQAMKDGVQKHGPVRQGLYSLLRDRAQ